jgi:hypothetical protein
VGGGGGAVTVKNIERGRKVGTTILWYFAIDHDWWEGDRAGETGRRFRMRNMYD